MLCQCAASKHGRKAPLLCGERKAVPDRCLQKWRKSCMHPCVRCVSKIWARCVASRPDNIAVFGRASDGSERRVLARARFEFGNAFGANGVNGATQFLYAIAEPTEFILGDAVVLRLCRAAHYAEWTRERPAFQ